MLLAILTAYIAYGRAKTNGRNPWLWAAIGAAVYIGTQLLFGLGIGIFLAFGVEAFGWPESVFDDYAVPINLVAVVFAFVATWLLLRFLGRPAVPEPQFAPPPPPPPDFGAPGGSGSV